MSEPFLAEIKILGFDFAPRGWAKCDGQILPINQNQALFSLLGTTYGGDGRVNFALPDLRGRVAISPDNNITLGSKSGAESVTLTTAEIPAHTHTPNANSAAANSGVPTNNFWSATGSYAANQDGSMRSDALAPNGGGQAHNNWSPYLVLRFVIALQGLFPPRN